MVLITSNLTASNMEVWMIICTLPPDSSRASSLRSGTESMPGSSSTAICKQTNINQKDADKPDIENDLLAFEIGLQKLQLQIGL
jgi:hypothetical protein